MPIFGKPWTSADDDHLRAHYVADGAAVCARALGRTVSAITGRDNIALTIQNDTPMKPGARAAEHIGKRASRSSRCLRRTRHIRLMNLDEYRVTVLRAAAGRFWAKVQKTEGCWLWTASKFRYGYGTFWANVGRGESRCTHAAHRVSYEIAFGAIPSGLVVMHSCDEPLCVRPEHLTLGTVSDNQKDMAAKGRSTHGSRNGRAVLTIEQVRDIRARRAEGVTHARLAAKYGVCISTIAGIYQRRIWRRA